MITKAEEYKDILKEVIEKNFLEKHKYALLVIQHGMRKAVKKEKHVIKFNMERISNELGIDGETHYEFSESRLKAKTQEQKNLFLLLDYLSRHGYYHAFLKESNEVIVSIFSVNIADEEKAVEI